MAGASTARSGTTSSPPPPAPPRKVHAARLAARPSECARVLEILEARELTEEGQGDRADRPVALLEHVHFRGPLVRRVRVVDLVAVDREDHVRILLDRAR